MKNLKYYLLFFLVHQSCLLLIAQIQPGTPWMNQLNQGTTLEGNGQEFIRQAEMHAQLYDIERATQALDNAVNFAPNSVEPLVRRAVFNRRIGRMYEAELDINRVNQLNPYAANLYGYYGHNSMLKLMAFEPLKGTDKGTEETELQPYFRLIESKDIVSNNVGIESDLLYEIIQDIELGKFEEGLHLAEAVITMYPESAISWDLKGLLHEQLGQIQMAKEAFSEAIIINETFAIAWYNLARIMLKEGNNAQAEVYLDRAILLENTLSEAYFQRAMLREESGNETGAVEDYNSMIGQEFEAPMAAYINRGLTKKVLGDFSGALADLDRAIAAQPKEALLYKNRANLMLLFGHYSNAIADYTSAIALDENLAEAFYNRGLTLLKLNNPVEACNDLTISANLGYKRAIEKQAYFCTY
jgi:tetratricopeptide (TPR) repeat protein